MKKEIEIINANSQEPETNAVYFPEVFWDKPCDEKVPIKSKYCKNIPIKQAR